MTTHPLSREARNIAAALYVHAGKPNEEVDLNELMIIANGCRSAIDDFLTWLEAHPIASEEEIQFEAYECGKRYLPTKHLRTFFSSVYLMLLAKPDGPRLGLMVTVTGVDPFVHQIRKRLNDPFGWLNTL